MNDRVPIGELIKESLSRFQILLFHKSLFSCCARFCDVFLKTYPYDPILKFQEVESGSYHTSMQSKTKNLSL